MPKYQKNKRRRRHHFGKIKKPENIEMVSEDGEKSEKSSRKNISLKILDGKRQTKKIRRLVFVGCILTIALVMLIISVTSPTGIGELYTNLSASVSLKSNLPAEINGTETYNVSDKKGYFYLLSDTAISAFTNNGKTIFSDNHGFVSPVISESEARTLIYDQNGTGLRIYNAKGLVFSYNSKNVIFAADIARNGSFAVASKAENYTSMVTVFDKKGKMLYEWYCPEEIINSVAVAPNGKSVAVSTVSVSGGKFDSTLYVLKYNSADPVFTKQYDGNLVYSIVSCTKKNFTVVCENKCDLISWKDFSVTTHETEYNVNYVRANHKRTVISSCRENNDGNYTFHVYDSKNKLKTTFDFDGNVDDFRIDGNNIFILSGNSVYLINSDGKIAKTGNSVFGTVKIIPVSSGSCLAVGHNSVTKIHLE